MGINDHGLYFVEGIPVPETPAAGKEPEPWKDDTRVVGTSVPRVDGYERLSGTAVYPSDVLLPGMLYGAILRSPHANAVVRKVDLSRAAKMPGVRAVLGPDDPEADVEWSWPSNARSRLFPKDCRFEGETVAAVAADTPHQARDALRAISVSWDLRPYVVDEEAALEDDAPQVAPGGNVVSTQSHSRGDVEKGFAQADVVVEETYRTAAELHTPMELHGCVARWDGDALTIWESTQGVFAVQSLVSEVLELPLSKVRVVGHYMGGGFGSKLRASKYTVITALLARKAARPVKTFLSREETFLAMGNRPPTTLRLKAGVKKDGTLTALALSGVGASGAFAAGGASLLDWLVRDLYTCPNVKTEVTDVLINTGPARPFRAPGHPQCAFALEQMMDTLAERIGMDPVNLRLKNVPKVSQAREGNPPYTTTGLKACLEEGAKAFGWGEARKDRKQEGHLRRGVGMAAALWIAGSGRPPSTVIVKLFSDGSVNLNMGASDIGTGTKTVMALVVAEELGVDPQTVQIENADTGTTQYATPSGGSKTVPTEAPTVRAAAVEVKRQLLELASEELGVPVGQLGFEGARIVARGGSKSVKVTELKTLNKRGVLMGVGHRGPNPEDKAISPFAAQFCEVEVNTRTGEVRLVRFLGAHESGRVLDRLTYDNQVIGGIAMGTGFAMTEQRVLDRARTGKLVSKNWHDYKLPTALDVSPEVKSLPIDRPDHQANATGAKGLGEPVTIPTAAAIANAVYDAVGVRMTHTFVNPVTLVARLHEEG